MSQVTRAGMLSDFPSWTSAASLCGMLWSYLFMLRVSAWGSAVVSVGERSPTSRVLSRAGASRPISIRIVSQGGHLSLAAVAPSVAVE